MSIRIVSKIGRFVLRNSSTILVGLGCAGSVAGTILACKKTLSVEPILDECVEDLSKASENAEENAKNKEITKAYIRSVGRMAKYYAPVIAIETLSIASILYGHHILSKRHFALIAAYNSLNTDYRNYRKRVVDKYGKDEDVIFANQDKIETIKEEDPEGYFPEYPHDLDVMTVFFGPGNINGTKDPEQNLFYLKKAEEEANALFHDQGYLFINDARALLGLEPTEMGSMIGWVEGLGDDYIDFNIYNVYNIEAVNGYEATFVVEFNHDGYILDKV